MPTLSSSRTAATDAPQTCACARERPKALDTQPSLQRWSPRDSKERPVAKYC